MGDWGLPQQARLSYKCYACVNAATGGVSFAPCRAEVLFSSSIVIGIMRGRSPLPCKKKSVFRNWGLALECCVIDQIPHSSHFCKNSQNFLTYFSPCGRVFCEHPYRKSRVFCKHPALEKTFLFIYYRASSSLAFSLFRSFSIAKSRMRSFRVRSIVL